MHLGDVGEDFLTVMDLRDVRGEKCLTVMDLSDARGKSIFRVGMFAMDSKQAVCRTKSL